MEPAGRATSPRWARVAAIVVLLCCLAGEGVYRYTVWRDGGSALGTTPKDGQFELDGGGRPVAVGEAVWRRNLHISAAATIPRMLALASFFVLLLLLLMRDFVDRVDNRDMATRNRRPMVIYAAALAGFWCLIAYGVGMDTWQRYKTSDAAWRQTTLTGQSPLQEGHHGGQEDSRSTDRP